MKTTEELNIEDGLDTIGRRVHEITLACRINGGRMNEETRWERDSLERLAAGVRSLQAETQSLQGVIDGKIEDCRNMVEDHVLEEVAA